MDTVYFVLAAVVAATELIILWEIKELVRNMAATLNDLNNAIGAAPQNIANAVTATLETDFATLIPVLQGNESATTDYTAQVTAIEAIPAQAAALVATAVQTALANANITVPPAAAPANPSSAPSVS